VKGREGRRKGMLLLALWPTFWKARWERCKRKGAASRRGGGGEEEEEEEEEERQVMMEETMA